MVQQRFKKYDITKENSLFGGVYGIHTNISPNAEWLLTHLFFGRLVLKVRHGHRLDVHGLGVHGLVISSLQGPTACTGRETSGSRTHPCRFPEWPGSHEAAEPIRLQNCLKECQKKS